MLGWLKAFSRSLEMNGRTVQKLRMLCRESRAAGWWWRSRVDVTVTHRQSTKRSNHPKVSGPGGWLHLPAEIVWHEKQRGRQPHVTLVGKPLVQNLGDFHIYSWPRFLSFSVCVSLSSSPARRRASMDLQRTNTLILNIHTVVHLYFFLQVPSIISTLISRHIFPPSFHEGVRVLTDTSRSDSTAWYL